MTRDFPVTVYLAKLPHHCITLQGTLTKTASPIPRTPSDSQVSQKPVQWHGKRSPPHLCQSHPFLPVMQDQATAQPLSPGSLLLLHSSNSHLNPTKSRCKHSLSHARGKLKTWGHKALSYESKRKKERVAPGDLLSSPRLAQVSTVFWKSLSDT